MFRRLLGIPPARPTVDGGNPDDEPRPGSAGRAGPGRQVDGDTATVRRIVARLEALPPDRARYLAGFAYVMSRAAHADLHISAEETAGMESELMAHGDLDEAQAVLVVEMAKLEARRHGATADYTVTRELAHAATLEQKLALLRCCFVVGAADATISAEEASVINQIAREMDVAPQLLNDVRAEFVDRLSAIQAMRRLTEEQ